MRILDRFVARSFLKLFLAFVIGAPLLFLIGDLTEHVDRYLARGVTPGEMVLAYVYQFPQYMLWSFPIAGLIAAVFTVQAMTAHHEVVAAKAGGISFHRLVVPIVLLGLLLTGVGVGLTELVPRTTRRAAELFREREVRRDWRTNFVYQTEDGLSITVARLSLPERTLQEVALEREAADGEGLDYYLIADRAAWSDEEGWTFHKGYVRHFLPEGIERAYAFDQYRTRLFSEPPNQLLEDPPDEEQMTYAEMGRMIETIRRSGGNPVPLRVNQEQKLAIPAATLVVILFGLPLATSSKRGGASFGVGVSLASTIFYMVFLRMAGAIGESGGLQPLLAAWLPNLAFLAAGAFLFSRVRT
ncbi:MAG: LptF/LptG family permease [Gemmatimonadota bacterium]